MLQEKRSSQSPKDPWERGWISAETKECLCAFLYIRPAQENVSGTFRRSKTPAFIGLESSRHLFLGQWSMRPDAASLPPQRQHVVEGEHFRLTLLPRAPGLRLPYLCPVLRHRCGYCPRAT